MYYTNSALNNKLTMNTSKANEKKKISAYTINKANT